MIDLGYRPHRFQLEAHRQLRRFSTLVAHRRWGKTVFAVITLIDAALRCTKPDGHFGYIAPQFNQAKSVAWNYIKRFGLRVPGAKVNESELSITFPNQGKVRLFGANNADALRGMYWDGVVLDEVADMAPEVWGEIIRPALSDRKGWALFIGTPKGVNLFSELYFSHQGDPNWFTGMFRADECVDDPGVLIDREELELARAAMSEDQFRQEFDCDFTASSDNTLLTIDVVNKAAGKHLREDQYRDAVKVMGVDVARFGGDRSVIQKRQGLYALEPIIFRGFDNMTLAGMVAKEIDEFQPDAVFIDAGRGEGVIDRLRQLGYEDIIEVNFGGSARDGLRYANKRAEMWFEMAEWFRSGGAIPRNQELISSLVVPTYKFDAANRHVLEKKEDMKERVGFSPDPGDALALTFAHPIRIHGLRRKKADTDYDVLAYGQGPMAKTNYNVLGG